MHPPILRPRWAPVPARLAAQALSFPRFQPAISARQAAVSVPARIGPIKICQTDLLPSTPTSSGAGDYTPNACDVKKGELDSHFSTYFASIAESNWKGGSVCGKCVRVWGAESGSTGKGVLFKIVDYCASGCDSGDLDFSRTGLKATTGYSWDEKKIIWDWATCDGPEVIYGGKGRSGKGRKMLLV